VASVEKTKVFIIWEERVRPKVSGRLYTLMQAASGLDMDGPKRYAIFVEGSREIGVVDWKCPELEKLFIEVKAEQNEYEKQRETRGK